MPGLPGRDGVNGSTGTPGAPGMMVRKYITTWINSYLFSLMFRGYKVLREILVIRGLLEGQENLYVN